MYDKSHSRAAAQDPRGGGVGMGWKGMSKNFVTSNSWQINFQTPQRNIPRTPTNRHWDHRSLHIFHLLYSDSLAKYVISECKGEISFSFIYLIIYLFILKVLPEWDDRKIRDQKTKASSPGTRIESQSSREQVTRTASPWQGSKNRSGQEIIIQDCISKHRVSRDMRQETSLQNTSPGTGAGERKSRNKDSKKETSTWIRI